MEGGQELPKADLPLIISDQHAHEGPCLLQVRLQQLPAPQPPCRRHPARRKVRLLRICEA